MRHPTLTGRGVLSACTCTWQKWIQTAGLLSSPAPLHSVCSAGRGGAGGARSVIAVAVLYLHLFIDFLPCVPGTAPGSKDTGFIVANIVPALEGCIVSRRIPQAIAPRQTQPAARLFNKIVLDTITPNHLYIF